MAGLKKNAKKETKEIVDTNATVSFSINRGDYEHFEDTDILRLKKAFGVSITFTGDRFDVTSSNIKQCRKAVIVLEKIFNIIHNGFECSEDDVTEFISEQNPQPYSGSKYKSFFTSVDGVEYSPRTANQETFINLINVKSITIAAGCAGTGKTRLASIMAAKYLTENRFDKVLIFRPLQAVGSKSLGYLPGSVSEKTDPYAQPIIDTFTELLGPKALDYYVKSKKIEIGSIALSRGSSYNSTLLILDEVQNMSKIEVLTLLTRMDFPLYPL
jgi:phosphate starvation-inducible PhoH-like protein